MARKAWLEDFFKDVCFKVDKKKWLQISRVSELNFRI